MGISQTLRHWTEGTTYIRQGGHHVGHWPTFLVVSFPRLISAVADWMSTILPHMMWPYSANLECRSEMCCTRLAENTGRKKSRKIRHLGIITHLCRAMTSQLRHISTIWKMFKNNISSTYPHNMVNLNLPTAEIGSLVWGTPANFNRFRVLASLLRCGGQPNFARCLAVSWAGTLYTLNHKNVTFYFWLKLWLIFIDFYSLYIILIVKKFYMRL